MEAATFFGEIVSDLSRAVDEDDDDDLIIESYSSCSIIWKPEVAADLLAGNKLKLLTIVVNVGPAATAFGEATMLEGDYELLGVVVATESSTDRLEDTSKLKRKCCLYRLSRHPEMLIIQCNMAVAAEQTFSWVEKIFDCIQIAGGNVVVLSSSSVSEYKTDCKDDLRVPFICALKSSVASAVACCPYLPQPNIITGLPAQILSFCEVTRIAAHLFTSFTDISDVETVKSFIPCLQESLLSKYFTICPSSKFKMIGDISTIDSSLYI